MLVTDEQVEAGAAALYAAFPTLHDDFTPAFFRSAARIVLQAGGSQSDPSPTKKEN